MNTEARIRIRVQLGDLPLFGPGKAALLTAIDEVGSIAGAARALGMSYRRAWLLVDSMNQNFTGPLVAASPAAAAWVAHASPTSGAACSLPTMPWRSMPPAPPANRWQTSRP